MVSTFRLLYLSFVCTLALPLLALAQSKQAVPSEFLMKVNGTKNRANAIQAQLGLLEKKHNPLSGSSLVSLADKDTFDHALAKQLVASGVVEYLEPNYIVSINATTPSDSEFNQLWGMHNSGQSGGVSNVDIDGPEAWDLNVGDGSVVVGVVDTGVDYGHVDLHSNMWTNPFEIPANGIDDDGNGVVDDVHGYDAIDESGNPYDANGHGTHCAGTIAAIGNNGQGVAGVAWNAKIMALRFLDANGSGTTQDAIEAIEYAIRMRNAGVNIRVLSNSWGGGGFSQALLDAIEAANAAGIVFVAAAGNNANNNDFAPTYPANYAASNIISVAAVDDQGNLASFSNYGHASVHLAAPGVQILSTMPGNSYQYLSGTSMATPHVSGALALLLSYQPSLSHLQAKNRIIDTAKPLSTLTNLVFSGAMLSAYNALANISNPNPPLDELPGYSHQAMALSAASYGQKLLATDDGYAEIYLPFSFPYYQRSYSRLALSANGRLIPLANGEAVPSTLDYTNRLGQAIAAYHDDLYPSPHSAEGGVWYWASASEARFTWVVTHYGDRNSTNSQAEMRIQARIFPSGEIQIHFIDTDAGSGSWSNGGSATIGLAPGNGVSGRNLLLGHNTPNNSLYGSGRAQRFFDDSDGTPENPEPPNPPEPRPDAGEGDIDGDGIRDIIVFRPSTGYWFILPSADNFEYNSHRSYQFGLPGDIPLLGDFDHDGLSDLTVWRPSNGNWYSLLSASGYTSSMIIQWGLNGDTPLVGDYDGDGWDDLAVYRTRTGTFYVLKSQSGFNRNSAVAGDTSAYIQMQLGGFGNNVVVGDFLGNGRDDFTTVWQLIRFWSVKDYSGALRYSLPWGEPGDTPLGCRMIDSGRDDRVMVRVAPDNTLQWYAVANDGRVKTAQFGSLGDRPGCADHDGDGIDDIRVYRERSGEWFILGSQDDAMRHYSFGLPGDVPL